MVENNKKSVSEDLKEKKSLSDEHRLTNEVKSKGQVKVKKVYITFTEITKIRPLRKKKTQADTRQMSFPFPEMTTKKADLPEDNSLNNENKSQVLTKSMKPEEVHSQENISKIS
tara:strand:+ start:199 stop:540 length:342 start_codon:yes stop_codon:yes gene_type:complete